MASVSRVGDTGVAREVGADLLHLSPQRLHLRIVKLLAHHSHGHHARIQIGTVVYAQVFDRFLDYTMRVLLKIIN